MPSPRTRILLASLVALALAGCGQAPLATARPLEAALARVAAAPPADAPPIGRLADFAWLTGRWAGAFNGLPLEESWLAPAAGLMAVSMYLHDGKRPVFLQLGALVETPRGVTFRFRHYTPDLTPLEGEPVALELVRLTAQRADFENSAPGRPKRTSFIREGEDALRVRSELVDGDPTQVHEVVVRRLR